MNKETKIKIKVFLRLLKKSIKPSNIIILILILSANTFAWFVYSQEVHGELSASVRSWKVVLENNNTEVVNYVDINIPEAYPGMDDFTDTIKVYNEGEANAKFEYTLMSVSLLGNSYYTKEKMEQDKLTLNGDELTSEEFLEKLQTDYPFKINISSTSDELSAKTGEAEFTLNMTWDYESGNDELDTKWGNDAYTFKKNNPSKDCISLVIRLKITQDTTE